jgi:DNA-binding NarL/FixJ family response regulator
MIRVLLVDDQEVVRLGYRMILDGEDDVTVVGEADNGADAVQRVGADLPDVIIMDVRMPRLDGVEATRQILASPRPVHAPAAATWPPRVLVVTTFELDDVAFSALEAGASGFMLKHASPDDLVNAVRVVAGGASLVEPSVTRRLIEEYVRPRSRTAGRRDDLLDRLTEREREILIGLARGDSNAALAASFYLAEATVKTHVSNLFAKLGIGSRAQAVVFAYETGLVNVGAIDLDHL